MNLNHLEAKLIAAARHHTPSSAVPYAFEKRIMARLAGLPPETDLWTLWNQALWRAAAPCVALLICLTVWSAISDSSGYADNPSEDFETLVLAGINHVGESW